MDAAAITAGVAGDRDEGVGCSITLGRAIGHDVHSPSRGAERRAPHCRLADMLGSRRPDIPILVVQSGHSGGSLNAIPGIDFSKYPQIMAAPPVPNPADYFALTRILVVPSKASARIRSSCGVPRDSSRARNRTALAASVRRGDSGGAHSSCVRRTAPSGRARQEMLSSECTLEFSDIGLPRSKHGFHRLA